MAGECAVIYEQARADLLVAQAVRDQPRDICSSFPEQPRAHNVHRRDRILRGFTKRQGQCRVPAQTLSGAELDPRTSSVGRT